MKFFRSENLHHFIASGGCYFAERLMFMGLNESIIKDSANIKVTYAFIEFVAINSNGL